MAVIKKGAKAVLMLSLVSFISVLPLIFSGDAINESKVDVYILIDHLRYPENIAYDISELFIIISLTYTIWFLIQEKHFKRYALSFLIVSLLGVPGYFLFYSKFVSLAFYSFINYFCYIPTS